MSGDAQHCEAYKIKDGYYLNDFLDVFEGVETKI